MNRIGRFSDWSIRRKLLASIIPAVLAILAVTGLASHSLFNSYISIALERNSLIQTRAQAHAVETLFNEARDDLILLASRPVNAQILREFLETRATLLGKPYAEIAYLSADPQEQLYFLSRNGAVVEPTREVTALIQGNPLHFHKKTGSSRPGSAALSELTDVVYPPPLSPSGAAQSLAVFRLTTPVFTGNGRSPGYLILSVDARAVRNILSLYNSAKSPLHGLPRAPENRLSLFVDDQGWMLFESENVDAPDNELCVASALAALSGDHGKPGFDGAFRPNASVEGYWRMVTEMQAGKYGLERNAPEFGPTKSASSVDFVGYAPVFFQGDPQAQPVMAGGMIYIDRSLLPSAAEFNQLSLMLVISLAAGLLISLLIYLVSRSVTRPIMRLTEAVSRMRADGRLEPLVIPENDLETGQLVRAVNDLTSSLAFTDQELRKRDADIKIVRSRERISLTRAGDENSGEHPALAALIGSGPAMTRLKNRIRKAASSDADVLLIGETGTGKELTAEAVHLCSLRASGPYVSINCGALDENLLMDALFGHVKGAFSEAKADRKGAFLAADGGALHLDEIGNASPKVQQSLLRALSVRRIRPLGSDQEIPFDVRVLAATNENLLDMVQAGTFREDLYYRLQVLTLATPPLRERPEDIPELTGHFLAVAARRSGRSDLGISRGALEKLANHPWPGNVRELQHALIRAAILCESDVIQADDLVIESGVPTDFAAADQAAPVRETPAPADQEAVSPSEDAEPPPLAAELVSPPAPVTAVKTNSRQARVLPHILKNGGVTRGEYQELLGGLPARTALYDLNDLVGKGLLEKVGAGPATRYVVVSRKG